MQPLPDLAASGYCCTIHLTALGTSRRCTVFPIVPTVRPGTRRVQDWTRAGQMATRNDQAVLRICPWPVRHRVRLAAEKAIVISGIGRNAMEIVLAGPPVYAGISPDMPTVRRGDDPNDGVGDAIPSFGRVH